MSLPGQFPGGEATPAGDASLGLFKVSGPARARPFSEILDRARAQPGAQDRAPLTGLGDPKVECREICVLGGRENL